MKPDLIVGEARMIGKRAWRVLPKKRGHVVIVFERAGPQMAIDAGTDTRFVPLILFRATVGAAGLSWLCKAIVTEVLNRMAIWMRIYKRAAP